MKASFFTDMDSVAVTRALNHNILLNKLCEGIAERGMGRAIQMDSVQLAHRYDLVAIKIVTVEKAGDLLQHARKL